HQEPGADSDGEVVHGDHGRAPVRTRTTGPRAGGARAGPRRAGSSLGPAGAAGPRISVDGATDHSGAPPRNGSVTDRSGPRAPAQGRGSALRQPSGLGG